MQTSTSIFLDLVRFAAACVVFLSHVTYRELNAVFPWVRWGHEAVVVFFVMSGFVIAYVASTRENTPARYAAARLGRLYSVVLPALLLTALLDGAGRSMDSELYAGIPGDQVILRLLVNLVFLQESWNLTVMPLSNGPFWSLGYEFWYYAIFGAWILARGPIRFAMIALFCLCAGPRIVAYMPLWLLGVMALRIYRNWTPAPSTRPVLLAGVSLAFFTILAFGNPLRPLRQAVMERFPDNYLDVGLGRLFLGDLRFLPEDMLLGALFAAMILLVRDTAPPNSIEGRPGVRAVRYLAGATFTLYLLHAPLLYFFHAWLNIDRNSAFSVVGEGVLVFVSCVLLSHLGERQVGVFRAFFLARLTRIAGADKPAPWNRKSP